MADELIVIAGGTKTAAKSKGGAAHLKAKSATHANRSVVSSTVGITTASTTTTTSGNHVARAGQPTPVAQTKSSDNCESTPTVSFFLINGYSASDKVLLKLVQSFRRSLHSCKRGADRPEAKRKGSSSWFRHVPDCCAGSRKSLSPPAADAEVEAHEPELELRSEELYSDSHDEPDRSEEIDYGYDEQYIHLCGQLQHLLDVSVVRTDEDFTTNDVRYTGQPLGSGCSSYDLSNDRASEPSQLRRAASERPDRFRRAVPAPNMGANVSSSARHHAKGLPGGRRAQSIDNLKSDTTQYFHQYHNNNNHHHGDPFHAQTFLPEPEHVLDDGGSGGEKPPPPDLACIDTSRALPRRDLWSQQQQQPADQHAIYVSQKDRNKFCGSLPNHLDLDGDSAIDRDCQAIVRQNEFLQANLKNVQQHQQQQQPTRNNGPVQQPSIGTPTRLTSMAPYSGQHSSEQHPQQQHPQQQQDQPFPQQPTTYQHRQQHSSFPPAGALGGSGIGVGSTFRSNTTESGLQQQHQQLHHHLQLKLPLHRTNVDAGCDQGYGSERSPEDELPPPLLLIHEAQYNEILASSAAQRASAMDAPSLAEGQGVDGGIQGPPAVAPTDQSSATNDTANRDAAAHHLELVGPYSFITEDCIFTVTLNKGPRGVGLSLSGGVDSSASYPGLIRIKRIFPHQAAWATGKLQPGDILLEVNGWPLTGLTNFQALMVLRGAWDEITLTVARPKGDQHLQLSPQTEPPKPPLRVTLSSEYFPRPQPEVAQESPVSLSGEFEIVLTKQQGSLGFTLSDESVHGHYVRMLMREPALTDGRIRPGDRILEVNHVPISSMTHSEAVLFLRRAADVVLLRLYRDPTQPLQSPADTDSISSSRPGSADRCTRPKACLRPEARSLLSALAATRQQQCQQQHAAEHSDPAAKSEDANSRRLRRAGLPSHRRPHAANSGGNYPDSCSDAASNASQDDERYYSDWELDYLLAEESGSGEQLLGDGDTGKATTGVPLSRPTFLDLDASIGGGGDALSSPNQRQLASDGDRGEAAEPGRDFTSLPCETFLVACKTDRDLQAGEDAYTDAIYVQHFARKSPLYSSVNVPASSGPSELVDAVQQGGKQSLLKWYGASMLDGAEDGLQPSHEPSRAQSVTPDLTAASETPSCSLAATRSTTPTTEIELCEHYAALALGRDTEGCEIYTADLHKGWNSRLGFSLKSEQDGSGRARTVISAIHPDSVASRNGRLRIGDVLLSVNEDSVESMPTAQVIELLRNARGSIFLVLMRPAGGGEGDPAAGKLKPTPEEPEDELDLEDAFRMVEELNRTLPEGASEGVVDGLE